MFPDLARRRGTALIITLSALVLITAAVLIFFERSILSRQIAFSSAGQSRAETVARTGWDTVVGDLRTEIQVGSRAEIVGGTVLYTPNTTPVANATMVPCRVSDQGFPNLVKQSASASGFWNGTNYNATAIDPTTGKKVTVTAPIRSASGNSTRKPSTNGRYIKPTRWNKPGLLDDPGPGPEPALPTGYATPPDWVVVTRQGAIPDAKNAMPPMSALANRNPNNPDYAIGRYAYTMYNEGGLADVNVAGFPASMTGTPFAQQHGLLPQVNLAGLSGFLDAYGFVAWRNPATASNYAGYVSSAANGFTTVAPGDQALVSRMDLLNYALANPRQISTAALPFIGTSSLDTGQPSFYPDPLRPLPDDDINPNVMKIRVGSAFKRVDGTQAVVGEPLLKHRFPLSRLALLGTPGADPSLIKKYFCMIPCAAAPGLWDYVDPDDPSNTPMTSLPTIKSLKDVAALPAGKGREPTFWELLQAGVLAGSVGKDSLDAVASPDAVAQSGCSLSQNQSATRQVFTMGLSIIDQYDTDDNPTVLNLGGINSAASTGDVNTCVMGVENLPYLIWGAENIFRDTVDPSIPYLGPPVGQQSYVTGYFIPAFWNPHRNASSAAPGLYRMRVSGNTYVAIDYDRKDLVTGDTVSFKTNTPSVAHDFTTSVLEFQTSPTRSFGNIDVLRQGDWIVSPSLPVTTSSDMVYQIKNPEPPPPVPRSATLEAGIFMGREYVPLLAGTTDYPFTHVNFGWNRPMTIVLEKQVGSNWIPYQIIPRLNGSHSNNSPGYIDEVRIEMNAGKFDVGGAMPRPMFVSTVHSDPRTNRLGFFDGTSNPAITSVSNLFDLTHLLTSPYKSISGYVGYDAAGSPGATITAPADYAYNQTKYGASTYADPDGVTRKGDSNPSSTQHQADSPYTYGGNACPVMLNRPFASVAEMGYAFRDSPWRSLNFSSRDSADGGLLDLFGLNENQSPTRAGVVDINGASAPVLQTLLMDAYQDPAITPYPMTAAQAKTIAGAIRTVLGPVNAPATVLRNVSDLPALIDKVAASPVVTAALPTTFEFKYNREAVTRSLADVMNTRTWNLLIDVVAQSGRYSPTSKSLSDFVVEGERRYWVHVALDRYTGKVLRTQAEPIIE